MIKWLGENRGELVGTNKYLCVQIRFFCRLHRGCSCRDSRMLWSPSILKVFDLVGGFHFSTEKSMRI
jgi:hypothetical protein